MRKIVDVSFPHFKIEVDAADYREAWDEAYKVLKRIQDIDGVDFDSFAELTVEDHTIGVSVGTVKVKIVNPEL